MQKNLPVFTGIDIGTTEVRCVIGYHGVDGSSDYSIAGVGTSPCQGVRKGVIIHPDEVADALHNAIEEAERQAGVRVRTASVLLGGSHIGSQTSKGVVAIGGAGRVISEDDKIRVEIAATTLQMPANREMIQFFAKHYRIDGGEITKNPVGMEGVRLEVDEQIITASTPAIRSLNHAFSKSGIHINHLIVAGLAAAESVLDRRQKESGTAIIDIGASTTSIAILEEGEIEHIAVIPVGGQNITNDLAIGLRTTLDIAEKVKLAFSGLDDISLGECSVEHNGEKIIFDKSLVKMIIESRVEELFELVDKEFTKVKKSKKLPGGVVFVGGSAQLSGIAEFAKDKLALPAAIGKVKGVTGLLDKVKNVKMATPIGIMMLDAAFSGSQSQEENVKSWLPDFKILNKFKR